MTKSEKLFERAVKRIPGGVNSPVRAYGAIFMMQMATVILITQIPGDQ